MRPIGRGEEGGGGPTVAFSSRLCAGTASQGGNEQQPLMVTLSYLDLSHQTALYYNHSTSLTVDQTAHANEYSVQTSL